MAQDLHTSHTVYLEEGIWREAGKCYERQLIYTSKEVARAVLVTRLRLIADEIEDRTRTPSGQMP